MWRMIILRRLRLGKVRISRQQNAEFIRLRLMGEWLAAMLEKHAMLQSPSQIESLVKIFLHATKVCESIFPRRLLWAGC